MRMRVLIMPLAFLSLGFVGDNAGADADDFADVAVAIGFDVNVDFAVVVSVVDVVVVPDGVDAGALALARDIALAVSLWRFLRVLWLSMLLAVVALVADAADAVNVVGAFVSVCIYVDGFAVVASAAVGVYVYAC